MVGAGTGVAPFRAFLEQREETGAGGRTWLFFGDRRFRTDFLYQLDWLRWRKQGVLTRMDVAFSRDASAKVYVQHRMLRAQPRALRLVAGGGLLLRLRRRETHGPRRARGAGGHCPAGRPHERANRPRPIWPTLRQQNRYQRDVY